MGSWRLILGDANQKVDPSDSRSIWRSAFGGGGGLSKTIAAGSTDATFENITAGTYAVRLIGVPDFRNRGGGGRGGRGGTGGRGGRGGFTPVVLPLGQITVQPGVPSQTAQIALDPNAIINSLSGN